MRGDAEWVRKQSESQKKRWQDPDYRKKMSEKRKDRKLTKEWKNNLSKSGKGKEHSISSEGREVLRRNARRKELKDGLIKFNKSDAKRKSASARMRKTWEENYDSMRQNIIERTNSEEVRKQLSINSAKFMATGFDPYKTKGRGNVQGVYYQSKLEKTRLEYLFENGFIVKRCSHIIEYEFEGRIKRYNPDFEVYLNNQLIRVEEVKTEYYSNDLRVIAKRSAGEIYFENLGIEYITVGETEIYNKENKSRRTTNE